MIDEGGSRRMSVFPSLDMSLRFHAERQAGLPQNRKGLGYLRVWALGGRETTVKVVWGAESVECAFG